MMLFEDFSVRSNEDFLVLSMKIRGVGHRI